MRKSTILSSVLALTALSLRADFAPALQWVQALGGSGATTVAGAATDSRGNFYIVGSTTSLDFPVTTPLQRAAGGSTLTRIDTATGASRNLYPPGLYSPTGLAADPRTPRTLYAGSANTIWRSADAGDTWTLLSQLPSGAVVMCLAVDPSNGNTLYAGTTPLGAFKSTDGGLTFAAINNGIKLPQYNAFVSNIYVDPNSPQVVFATAPQGLVRSADGGATWTVAVGAVNMYNTLVFDPFSPGTVYVAAESTVLRSTDDGQTFTPQSSLASLSFPNAMAADPFHPGVLFANLAYLGVYRSSDSGDTWTKVSAQQVSLLAADPNHAALYSYYQTTGLVKTADGFNTTSPVGPPLTAISQLVAAGPNLFAVSSPTNDVVVVKLDSSGNVAYSTYFGGSADDKATAVAVGADGSVYVTGTTTSTDFPVTPGAQLSSPPPTAYPTPEPFLFKVKPDGSLAWSTYFGDYNTTPDAIAVDSGGNPYVATTVAGPCMQTWMIGCIPGPPMIYVTRFKPDGTGQGYSTQAFTGAGTGAGLYPVGLAIDPTGNAYVGGLGKLALLNSTGTAVLATTAVNSLSISALALDANLNLYAAGWWENYVTGGGFYTPPGAFQPEPQPAVPLVPGEVPGGGTDAIVMKWDGGLTQVLAATLLGGESTDQAENLAFDGAGNVIVSGFTDSQAFPTHAPYQTKFSTRSGFVAGLDSNLSRLLFSTHLGDGRAFEAVAAVPDGNGNILLAGATLTSGGGFYGGDPGASYTNGGMLVANKIALPPPPAARLDSVINYASRMAAPLSPGESIAALGVGFGSDAQLLVDGIPLPLVSRTTATLVGVLPESAKTSGAFQLQVSTGGSLSNPVLVPAAAASPGIYSVDGSGYGQGYILNGDGTLNSPSNPAAPGAPITIFATGVGAYRLDGQYAVTALMPSVYVDGFYADGIAATMAPVAGLPGNIYKLGVFLPDPATLVAQNPNLLNFKMPPQVRVRLVMGAVNSGNPDNSELLSQQGIILNVKQ